MNDELVTKVETGGIEAVHLRLTYEEYKALKAFLGSTSPASRAEHMQNFLDVNAEEAANVLSELFFRMPETERLKDY